MIDPLWHKFEVVLLTYNHRQGEDRSYAEILNRMRTGEHTEEDCRILEQRVKQEGSKDLPTDALHIHCTNAGVNKINELKLNKLKGLKHTFIADITRGGKKYVNNDGTPKKPKMNNDGSITNTTLQFELSLKIGAQVMLKHNVDVLDSLANGTIGEVVGFETTEGVVKNVLVQFNDEKAGRERRKKNSAYIQQNFPNIPVTPISKIECRFSLSKNPTSQNDFMLATQFPLKLAFCCTCHSIQGQTVVKPRKLVIDLKSVKEAAQGYVMLSRVQAIDQVFILNEFPPHKIYPWPVAIEELRRLHDVAMNEKLKMKIRNSLILTLNIRSLVKHHVNIVQDYQIRASVIALQETWCSMDNENNHMQLPGYSLHLVSQGRGKGVATYFEAGFQISGAVNTEHYQISKVSGVNFDVVNVYCSRGLDKKQFLNDLGSFARGTKPCFIVGDFNVDFLKEPKDPIIKKIVSSGFKQMVTGPTHIEGSLLDHVYMKGRPPFDLQVHTDFTFYSDHAAVSLVKS